MIIHKIVSSSCVPIEHLAAERPVGTVSHSRPGDFGSGLRRQTGLEPRSEVPVQSVVKWFDSDKGFGFVTLSDGSGDALLHVSVLARSGFNVVQPGEILKVCVGPGHRGQHVNEVLRADGTSATPATGPQTISRIARPSRSSLTEERGTVNSFNVKRGYGFIVRDQGGRDVFVDTRILQRCDIRKLSKGQHVIVKVVEGPRGPRAVRIRLVGLGKKQLDC
jgi:CspA family cold shock protein